jgi:uncharacterized protein with HEPN domain
MTRHDDTTRLRHMLDHALDAVDMAQGRQRQDLESDRQFCYAMTHVVGIIGEAAAHISPEGRDRWPDIPWHGVIGLRNRLIHGYDAVDLDILWTIIHDDLPPLIAELRRALGES